MVLLEDDWIPTFFLKYTILIEFDFVNQSIDWSKCVYTTNTSIDRVENGRNSFFIVYEMKIN